MQGGPYTLYYQIATECSDFSHRSTANRANPSVVWLTVSASLALPAATVSSISIGIVTEDV